MKTDDDDDDDDDDVKNCYILLQGKIIQVILTLTCFNISILGNKVVLVHPPRSLSFHFPLLPYTFVQNKIFSFSDANYNSFCWNKNTFFFAATHYGSR